MSYSKIDTWSSSFFADSNFVLGNAQVPPSYPIVYCSDGFCELTGYPRAQIMQKGCACKFLFGPDTDEAGKEDIADSLFDKTELKLEIQLYKKGGTLHMHISPLFSLHVVFHSSSLFWQVVIVSGIASIWRIWAEQRRTFFIKANLSSNPPNPNFFSWFIVFLLSRKKFVLVPFGHCAHQEREKSSGAFLSLPQGHYSQ